MTLTPGMWTLIALGFASLVAGAVSMVLKRKERRKTYGVPGEKATKLDLGR